MLPPRSTPQYSARTAAPSRNRATRVGYARFRVLEIPAAKYRKVSTQPPFVGATLDASATTPYKRTQTGLVAIPAVEGHGLLVPSLNRAAGKNPERSRLVHDTDPFSEHARRQTSRSPRATAQQRTRARLTPHTTGRMFGTPHRWSNACGHQTKVGTDAEH